MPRYNTDFKLDLHDIDLIENALQTQVSELSRRRLTIIADGRPADGAALSELDRTLNDINGLMGRLHNQKVFFRPKLKPYVSG